MIGEMQVPQTCVYCDKIFMDMQSLGRHQCRWHPGQPQWDETLGTIGVWSCCGTLYEPMSSVLEGCMQCDHTAVHYNPSLQCNHVTIPRVVARYIGVPTLSTMEGRRELEQPQGGSNIHKIPELKQTVQVLKTSLAPVSRIFTTRPRGETPRFVMRSRPMNDLDVLQETVFNGSHGKRRMMPLENQPLLQSSASAVEAVYS